MITQNIDMFMACCDWEAAIEEERESSHQHQSEIVETQLHENNGTEGDRMKSNNSITNHQIKVCKRKIKSDLKSRNTLESLNLNNNNHTNIQTCKNESQVVKEPEIDIDSMMKKTPPNEMQRRVQRRNLQQRGKKRSPTKQILKKRF